MDSYSTGTWTPTFTSLTVVLGGGSVTAFQILLAFGVSFELPIFILFLAKIGGVSERMLRQQRKFAIVIIFTVAAILTPPDVFSQCLMAAPLLILYEISIIVARIFGKKSTASDENEVRDAV